MLNKVLKFFSLVAVMLFGFGLSNVSAVEEGFTISVENYDLLKKTSNSYYLFDLYYDLEENNNMDNYQVCYKFNEDTEYECLDEDDLSVKLDAEEGYFEWIDISLPDYEELKDSVLYITVYMEVDGVKSEEIEFSVLLLSEGYEYVNEEFGIEVSASTLIYDSEMTTEKITDKSIIADITSYDVLALYKLSYTYNDLPTIEYYDEYSTSDENSPYGYIEAWCIDITLTDDMINLVGEFDEDENVFVLLDSDFNYIDTPRGSSILESYTTCDFATDLATDGYIYIALVQDAEILVDSAETTTTASATVTENPQTGNYSDILIYLVVLGGLSIIVINKLKKKDVLKKM